MGRPLRSSVLLVAAGMVMVGPLSGCGDGDGAASREGSEVVSEEEEAAAPTEEGREVEEGGPEVQVTEPLECEERGFPCSWAEVDPEVADRSRIVGEEGLERVLDESPTETVAWLRAQDGVVDAGASVDSAALWFRMEGGRRVYIEGKTPASFDGVAPGDSNPSAPDSSSSAPDSASPVPGALPSGPDSASPVPGALPSGPDAGSSAPEAPRDFHRTGLQRAGLMELFLPSFSGRGAAGGPEGSGSPSGTGGGTLAGPSAVRPSVALPSTVPSSAVRARGVAGRDRNEDSEVDQRDQRKALVLDPLYWEFCYEFLETGFSDEEEREVRDQIVAVCEGEADVESLGIEAPDMYRESDLVKAELEHSSTYSQNVTVLKNEQVDFGTVASWPEYDVIHLASHGSSTSWTFGKEVLWPRNGKWSSVPRTKGLDIWYARAGDHGPRKAVYSAGVDFFRTSLPRGLSRSMLFISACNGLGSKAGGPPRLVQHMIRGDAMFIGWSMTVGASEAQTAATQLYDVLSRGWSGRQALDSLPDEVRAPVLQKEETEIDFQDLLLVGFGFLGHWGADLRIQEMPELLHPRSVLLGVDAFPLQDGGDIVTLLDGLPGDGEDDRLSAVVEVDAVTLEEAPRTFVHLELDGTMVGEPEALSVDEETRFELYRKEFEDVPLELDIEPGQEYELAAVVEPVEGGESRYGARLVSEECSVPLDGYFEGNAGGAAARRVESESQNTAKIVRRRHGPDPSGTGQPPLGEWHLSLRSGVTKGGDDFDLNVYVPEPIQPGQAVVVTDVGLVHAAVAGGVSEPEDLTWLSGTVRILITGIDESPGSGDLGVCGDISADLTGGKEPPPGVVGFVELPVSFNGKFRAVWSKG